MEKKGISLGQFGLKPIASTYKPNEQQQAVTDWVLGGEGSLNLIACAGTGKTSCLIHSVLPYLEGDTFFGAFNKSIAMEIQDKVSRINNLRCRVRVSTMHAAGFNAWKYKCGPSKVWHKDDVTEYKVRDIIDKFGEKDPQYTIYRAFLSKLVSFAKQSGFGVSGMVSINDYSAWENLIDYFSLADDLPNGDVNDYSQLICMAMGLYMESLNTCTKVVDFDDMLLAPLYFNARFYPQDWVLIDEAQDTNSVRREMALRMLKPSGRLIAVGDPHQAIYGFTGADSDSMGIIQERLKSMVLPLTITYRCPKLVVQLAQQYVPEIQAHESSPMGTVRTVYLEPTTTTVDVSTMSDPQAPPMSLYNQPGFYPEVELALPPVRASWVVLCRNNKPLVEVAYQLLRKRIPCRVEGRDIGTGLIRLAQKWKVTTLDALATKLANYKAKESARMLAKKMDSKAAELEDRIDTMFVLMDAVRDQQKNRVQDLIDLITSMFGDTPTGQQPECLILSTIHKSKGREWDRVYILGANRYMPSKWAKKDWEVRAEQNLAYVAYTRAKQELVHIVVPAESKRRKS